MKIKYSPVVYVLVLYLLLSAYLIYSYTDFNQYLTGIELVDLTPVAYMMLIFSIALFVLAAFSIFRIPLFHYLFKMLHLWMVIGIGVIAGLYIKYGTLLWGAVSNNAQHDMANAFPGTDPGIFQPLIHFIQYALNQFRDKFVIIILIAAVIVAIVQVILYLPSSLRYVYHTHISPFKYIFKHIFVSVVVLAAMLVATNFYVKSDGGVNPQVESLLATKTQPVNDAENAFYPMMTVWMPDETNRTAAGKRWISEYGQMVADSGKSGKTMKLTENPFIRKYNSQTMNPLDREEINQIYIKRLRERNYTLGQDVLKYAERYRISLGVVQSLFAYKKYQNPVKYTGKSYTGYFNGYVESLLALHRLNLLVGLIENNEENKLLIKNTFPDYLFDLMAIKNATDPVNKMLFIDKISITMDFLNTLLHDPAYQNSTILKPIELLPVLDKEMLDYSNMARARLLFYKKQFDSYTIAAKSSAVTQNVLDYSFKYNKTLNCIYANLNKELNLDNKTPLAHLEAQKTGVTKPRLVNVAGDIICNVSTPEYESTYFTREVETNGRILMLKARAKALEKGISEFNMTAFLTNNSDKYYNPFTREALKWDSTSKQVYFEYNNGKNNVRVSL